MKRILIGILILIISGVFSISVLASDVEKLTMQSAVNRALVKNIELRKAELNFEKARLEYEKKKANNLINQSNYNELEAEYSLMKARDTYKNTRDNIIKTTIQQYTDFWLNKLNIDVKKKRVEAEKLLLEQKKAQHEIGDIGNIDLLEQENSYKDAQFQLEKAKDQYNQSFKKLQMTLNIGNDEGNAEIKITAPETPKIWDINEKEAINTALENNIELKLSKKEEELAQIDLKRAKISAPELDLKIKKIALKISGLETESIKEDITTSTQEAFYQFKQAIKDMGLKEKRLSKAREEYNLIDKQYEAGLGTKTDVLQYEANMLETEYSYKTTIVNYYLTEHSLRQTMNLETGVFVDETTKKK